MKAADLFSEHFESELLGLVEDHPDMGHWSVAGRAKKNPEDVTWWRTNGPKMVDNYVRWRHMSGWKPWRTPDGELAIELDISIEVGGCTTTSANTATTGAASAGGARAGGATTSAPMPLKMYVDQVMVAPKNPATPSLGGNLVIVDLKTGARTPDSDLQLGVYRLGILKKYGVDVRLGAYWMARKGELSEVFDLSRLRPELLELWFRRFRQATDAGLFVPHPTALCRACAMRDYCSAYGGSKQAMDPDNDRGTSV